MKQFDLSLWLQDKSRKVVTRDGRPVRIVCWDLPGEYKILAIIDEKPDGSYTVLNKKCDGTGGVSTSNLFFADEEKTNKILDELKSYLKNTPKEQVEKDWKEIQDWYNHHFTNEEHDEEEELTELQKTLEEDCDCYVNLYNDGKTREELREWIKCWCNSIIDLARKEISKSLPKWKKAKKNEELDCHVAIQQDDRVVLSDFVQKDEYYITLDALKKLPKEE